MKTAGSNIVAVARSWLGTPYRHQGCLKGVGCDCLGLVRGVWQEIHGHEVRQIPPYSRHGRDVEGAERLLEAAATYLVPRNVPVTGNLEFPGSVVLFQLHGKLPPRHCGIIVQDNGFIHAQERLGVIVTPFNRSWRRRVHSIYDF